MRVLYVRDGFGVHDERFVAALRRRGHEVAVGIASGEGWVVDGRAADPPDPSAFEVVQIGPLPLLGRLGSHVGPTRVVATCWGRDAFEPLADDAVEALRRAATVLCDCRAAAERLVALGVELGRIVSFPWGIDLRAFQSAPSTPPSAEVRLVTTRSLDRFYRHDLVLEAVRALRLDGVDVRIALYGDGPHRDELQQLASALELDGVATFLPPVGEADLAGVLRSATAWVNAAPLDGICISLLQAVATGCGVVTTDVPCAREAAGPAEVVFFPEGDLDGLTAALAATGRPSPDAVLAGRRWLEEYADWERNASRYVDAVEGR